MSIPHTIPKGSAEVRLTLPFPDKHLNPNSRIHWRRKSRLVKVARHAAWGAMLEVFGASPHLPPGARIALGMTFCPPDFRRRDLDNLVASMKAATDGIADALGVDDSRFIPSYSIGEPVKGGAVHVTVRAA